MVKRHPYWYVRECRRVNGRVVTSWQRYLGSADHIAARLAQPASAPPTPSALHVCHAGHTAAWYAIAQQMGVADILDRHAPKRAQGPSCGQFMLVAALNRICAPCGTRSIPAWLEQTPLPRWLGHPPAAPGSQAFWNHMHRLSHATLRAIEQELAAIAGGYLTAVS